MSSQLRSKTGFLKSRFMRFLRDNAGSVTPLLGLASIPVFLASGAALDMARINREQTAFHAAVESAALAVAADDRSATAGLSPTELASRKTQLLEMAKKYVAANFRSSSGGNSTINLDLTITGQAVTLTSSLDYPTTIMQLVGFDSVTLSADATVKKAMRPIELVMVMDTTGSMNNSGKISGAKDAAKKLLNTLYSGTLGNVPRSEFIRTALVPFAAAVKLDTQATDFNLNWIDTTGANPLSRLNFNEGPTNYPGGMNNYTAWSKLKETSTKSLAWNGCVEARTRTNNLVYDDIAPNALNPDTLFPAYFNFDAPGTTSTSDTMTSYGYSYLGGTSTTAVGSECRGLTSTQCTSTSGTAAYKYRQENPWKYDGAVIGAESTSNYGPWMGCAVSKVVPMTYDRAATEAGIDAMVAAGPTLIAEGLAWGWRAISPGEPLTQVQGSGSIPSADIAPYGDARWQKIMVLMTDGDNDLSAGGYSYNGTIYSAYGVSGEVLASNRIGTQTSSNVMGNLDQAMLNVCQKIKDNDIELYVASFGTTISASTKSRLLQCATDADHYAHATTSADLVAFFDHIGENVLNKSIYVSN